jgi:pyruvate ferredoxin oxidoreductase gamma subunit
VLAVPATEFAREHVGKPLPNAALLGAFSALTQALSLDSVTAAIRDRFPGRIADGNVAAAQAAHDFAVVRRDEVIVHA